jgi:hypothetical protein
MPGRTTLDFLRVADAYLGNVVIELAFARKAEEDAARALDDSEDSDDREVRRLHLLCADGLAHKLTAIRTAREGLG